MRNHQATVRYRTYRGIIEAQAAAVAFLPGQRFLSKGGVWGQRTQRRAPPSHGDPPFSRPRCSIEADKNNVSLQPHRAS